VCVCVALSHDVFTPYNTQASDVGWVVGHTFIVYGPLLNRSTTVMFEGKPVGTPDAGAFWRMIDTPRVTHFYTAPTAVRAIKKEDPTGVFISKYRIKGGSLRAMFCAGERSDPDTVRWAQQHITPNVVDNYWQTETGWPISAVPQVRSAAFACCVCSCVCVRLSTVYRPTH